MTPTAWLELLPYLLAGVLLGAIHFGGLWWTVRRLPTAAHPALWTAGSFLLRSALVLAGFALIARQGWPPTLAALAGLLAIRLLLTRLLGTVTNPHNG
ncbi:ATP synthase subunit I [Endothiovibrio diazotrophicus]